MISEYLNIFKIYYIHILTLGFAYGATIVFTFFGPVMIMGAQDIAPALSLIAVVMHVLSFYIPLFDFESRPWYFPVILAGVLPLVLTFYLLPSFMQVVTTALYAWMIGRIGCVWTYSALRAVPNPVRGRVVSASLFLSFLILYLVNMGLPDFSKAMAMSIPAVLICAAVVCCRKMTAIRFSSDPVRRLRAVKVPHYFSFLLVVYISGGFSYAGIYPSFEPYAHVDRYYNVLFFLVAIGIAGKVLDTAGRKVTFILGVVMLSVSFTFFVMPSTLPRYLVTQTFLQAGWAFVNAFGWSFSWDMAARCKEPYLFARGISAMLLGAAAGAFLSEVLKSWGTDYKVVYGILTFMPLFFSIMWLVYFPETLNQGKR